MDNQSFNSVDYHHVTIEEIPHMFNHAASNGYKKTNSFNIYIASGGTAFGGAAEDRRHVNVVTHYGFASGTEDTMVHEIGHCFNLFHTFNGWTTSQCEHVTRDDTNSNYNADDHGDHVTDTAAVPDFKNERCHELNLPNEDCTLSNGLGYAYLDQNLWVYTGNGGDCLMPPIPYEIAPLDVKNYLSYTLPSPTPYFKNFTVGQKIRMREAIINDDVFHDYENAATVIDALYEPYKGEYYLSGPSLPIHSKPLFQPGFEYRFVSCTGPYPQPSDYAIISFPYNINTILLNIEKDEQDYNLITHPNHSAIAIKHLHPDFWPQPRKCYDNYNKAAKDGRITKFNDNTFNTNVTITIQDSIGINNPQLIDNLQPGLYNIIENYDVGATKETVILKENN